MFCEIKVADFGHARLKVNGKAHVQNDRVALAWAAPETISTQIFCENTDIWSYG